MSSLAFPLIITAILTALLSGIISLWADNYPLLLRRGAFWLLTLSGLAAIVGGTMTLLSGTVVTEQIPLGLPWLSWQFRLDPLSAWFILIIGLVTFAISFYGPDYVREFESSHYSLAVLGLFTGLFIASMLIVLLANDALSFMVGWEIMSLSSYFLVAYQHLHAANRRAAFLYLLMAHIGGLSILLAFAVLASFGNDFSFDAMRQVDLSFTWATIAFSLSLFGFGMKAGLLPLHVWLPEAHPVAPSHISALMSGVMLKIAIYGLIRMVFDLIGPNEIHWAWGLALLFSGSLSALIGILYALMQNDLKRLLAYSSIENIGVICTGLGLSLLFIAANYPTLGALGLIAVLYHCLNHSLFKSLLFLGAGAILHSSHERNLEHMGGLIHRLPITSTFFLIGCLSISALPPFNGFVSEWLTFQTALQAPNLESGVLRAMVPIAAALLALTGALSATCFVKVYGIAFLGHPRTRHIRQIREVSFSMQFAMGFLALLCLVLGVFPTTVIHVLESVPQQLLHIGLPSDTAEGWLWLTPISGAVASYSAPLVILSIIAVWGLSYLLLHGHKTKRRRAIAWGCGFGTLNVRMQYTATAFAMPILRVFRPVWWVKELVEESNHNIRYHLGIADRAWPILYESIHHWVAWSARLLGWIQTGNIRIYLSYSFFTLLVLLWFIT